LLFFEQILLDHSKLMPKGQEDKTRNMEENRTSMEEEPIEYLNDKHLLALEIIENGVLPENLKNCGYEKVFRISSLKQLKTILSDQDQKDTIRETIRKFGFKKASCVFIYTDNFNVSLDLQKATIDYQADLFDDITITYLRRQPDDLLFCLEYAKTKDKEIAVFTDFRYTTNTLETVTKTVLEDNKVNRLKVRYAHIQKSDNLQKYRILGSLFADTDKTLHLVLSSKKMNLFGFEDFAFEFLARLYGFISFCHNFQELKPKSTRKIKGRRFILRGFDRETLFYKRTWGLAYRGQILRDLALVSEEMNELNRKLLQKKLPEYAKDKKDYLSILEELELLH